VELVFVVGTCLKADLGGIAANIDLSAQFLLVIRAANVRSPDFAQPDAAAQRGSTRDRHRSCHPNEFATISGQKLVRIPLHAGLHFIDLNCKTMPYLIHDLYGICFHISAPGHRLNQRLNEKFF
jgi:hypothetical protein